LWKPVDAAKRAKKKNADICTNKCSGPVCLQASRNSRENRQIGETAI